MQFVLLVIAVIFFFGPFWALGELGYRYGYRQEITKAGLAWRVPFFCLLLSWSIIEVRDFHVFVAYPLPSIICLYLSISSPSSGITYIPPTWVAPALHIIFYMLSVAHGYRTRQKTYKQFPE